MNWSIRTRLTAWYSAVVVAVLVAGAAAVSVVQWRLGVERLDGELRRQLMTLEGVMRTEFGEGLDLQAAADEASIEVIAPDRALVLAAPDGRIIAAWGRTVTPPWLPPLQASVAIPQDVATEHGNWRAVGRAVDVNGHRYVAGVLAPLDELNSDHAELLTALSAGVLVALLVAGLGGAVIGRQALRPLEDMANQATTITEEDPSGRLVAPHPFDELGQLAAAFNALLDRLAAALQLQRQFMADASHELRTPVSVVRTTAQVTLARDQRSQEEYREALEIVADQSSRLTHLVDAMFMLSRAEAHGVPLTREPVYLNDLVSECVRGMRVLALSRNVTIELRGNPEIAMSADDGLLRRVFGNLLDNAIRHAAATISVTLERDADTATVRVWNDGPAIASGDQRRIFERFVRLELGHGGAGLGLPIARTIAEAHGGSLVLEDSSQSGTCFCVKLPLFQAGEVTV
jgi:signal transduction histidine kinase